MANITENELLNYLGIDYADTMVKANIKRSINAADAYLRGSVGENYPADDPRAVELALIIAADFYENRSFQASVGGSVSANARKLVEDMSLQLRLEMREAAENV